MDELPERRSWRVGGFRVWFYRMPWSLNYRWPRYYRLRDGWHVSMLSFVLMVGKN